MGRNMTRKIQKSDLSHNVKRVIVEMFKVKAFVSIDMTSEGDIS